MRTPVAIGAVLMVGLAMPLAGCIVKTAVDVATLPVKAGGKVVGSALPSQAKADRAYGRKMRKEEAREGRERREWAKRCKATPDAADCASYNGYRAGQE